MTARRLMSVNAIAAPPPPPPRPKKGPRVGLGASSSDVTERLDTTAASLCWAVEWWGSWLAKTKCPDATEEVALHGSRSHQSELRRAFMPPVSRPLNMKTSSSVGAVTAAGGELGVD
jgi:hypothetical protein